MASALMLLAMVVLFGAMDWIRTRGVPAETSYAGSDSGQGCHASEYRAWKDSLHQKMMRRVDQPGIVVADLDAHADALSFDGEQAVWAIGGKWEQQFMGEDALGEMLLPGAWLRAENRWDSTNWDGWQLPVPLTRCHGCHTMGLNVLCLLCRALCQPPRLTLLSILHVELLRKHGRSASLAASRSVGVKPGRPSIRVVGNATSTRA